MSDDAAGFDRSLLHLLHRAGQGADGAFASEVRDGALTPRQFAVLAAVAERQGSNQTQIVERTGIDRSTLADIVKRLVSRGLLRRRRTKEDARAYAVALTQQGEALVAEAQGRLARVDEALLASLPAADAARFRRDLAKIVAALDASRDEPARKSDD